MKNAQIIEELKKGKFIRVTERISDSKLDYLIVSDYDSVKGAIRITKKSFDVLLKLGTIRFAAYFTSPEMTIYRINPISNN